jgi:hypothetical protein
MIVKTSAFSIETHHTNFRATALRNPFASFGDEAWFGLHVTSFNL